MIVVFVLLGVVALLIVRWRKKRVARTRVRNALVLARAFHQLGWNFLRGTGEPAIELEMARVGLFEPSNATETTCTEAMTAAFPGSGLPVPLVPSRAKPLPLTAMWHQGVPEYVEMAERLEAAKRGAGDPRAIAPPAC